MNADDDDETTTEAVQQAADAMLAACHAAHQATYAPAHVCRRLEALLAVLDATRQLALMTAEVLNQTERMDLGTDDGSEPADHIEAAHRLLLAVATEVGDATACAYDARSQLSPIVLRS